MKLWIGAGALGILIGGAGGTTYWQQRRDADLKKAQEQLEALQQLHLRTVSELEKAKQVRPLADAGRPAGEEVAASGDGEAAAMGQENTDQNETPEQQAERRRAFTERAIERGMERWKGMLNLRPDQIAQLENLLKNKLLNNSDLNRREAFQQIQQQLLSVLTPEQKTQYEHVQNRENQARVESRSYQSMFQVQSAVDLTDTQKDQLLQKFATLQQNQENNWGGNREARQQQELEALKGILTPAQIVEYQKAQQFNQGRGGGGRGGRGGGGGGAGGGG